MRDSSRRISARVDTNRIERCKTSNETISVKSSGNVISNNTLTDCNNITNRHGDGNIYQSNTLVRSYGIVVHDSSTRLIGNQITTAARDRGYCIMGGDISWSSLSQGGHPQAYNTFVSGNNGPLIVGAHFSGDNLPALNTNVESHNGTIELRQQQNTTLPPGAVIKPGGNKPPKGKKSNTPEVPPVISA